MKRTENLRLPIYDSPETDLFKFQDWNEGNQNIENKIKEINSQLDQMTIMVESFGAKGDGVTLDTKAFKDAVAYCKANGYRKITLSSAKKYVLDEPIICDIGIMFECNGAEIIWNNKTKNTGNFESNRERYYGVISFIGTGRETFNIQEFNNKIVENGKTYSKVKINTIPSYLKKGDYIFIGREIEPNLELKYVAGFNIMCKVLDIVNGYIYIDYFSPFDFTEMDLSKFTLKTLYPVIGGGVKNLYINDVVDWKSPSVGEDGINLTKVVSGVGIYYGVNQIIENVKGTNTKFPLVMAQYGYNIQSKNINCERPAYNGGGQGYTAHYCGVMNGRVENAEGVDCRHIVDFSYSAFCTLKGVNNSTTFSKDFDLHGIWEHDITVENCNIGTSWGNGVEYFPCMVANITVRNSTIKELKAVSASFGLYLDNCNILSMSEFNTNKCEFHNTRFRIANMRKISPYITDKVGYGEISFYNCQIDLDGGTYLTMQFDKYNKISFDNKCVVGNGNNSITLSMLDVSEINFNNCLFNNVNFRNVGAEKLSYSFNNSLLNYNSNYNLQNKIIRFDESENKNIDFTFRMSSLSNTNTSLFTFSNPLIPFAFSESNINKALIDVSSFINTNNLAYNRTNLYFNNTTNTKFTIGNIVNENFWYKTNISDISLSSLNIELGKYQHIGTIRGSSGSASIMFSVTEVKNAFSSKYINANLTVYKTSSTERVQFYSPLHSVFTVDDLVYTKETLANGKLECKVYIKTVSANDVYNTIKQASYNDGDFEIEFFNVPTVVDSLTSTNDIVFL